MNKNKGSIYPFVSFKYFFENAREAGIILFDKNGIIIDSNIGMHSAYGYSSGDLVGKNFAMLFTLEDRLKNKPEIELVKILQEGVGIDQNYIVHKNGSHLWSTGESVLTQDDKGAIVVVKIIYDINQQKLLEKFLINANEELTVARENLNQANIELQAKNEELSKTVKDLDTFVYTASHDMKAPISNIEALVSYLFEDIPEDCKKKEGVIDSMEMINKSIEKFKETINDLSVIGKLQTDSMESYLSSNFKEIMQDIKLSLNEMIENNDARIIEDFTKAPEVNLSRKNVRSLLYNLVSNAIKYRSPKRQPEVRIITQHVDGFVLLQVRDNGLGIKAEDKEKIFSMYERIHHHVEGSGIGMGIVKKIIDNNEGRVEVESQLDQGTVFNIYIKNQDLP